MRGAYGGADNAQGQIPCLPKGETTQMKYMLMIYGNRQLWESFPEEEFAKIIAIHSAFDKEIRESGEYAGGAGLAFEDEVKTVKVENGVTVVTDGPFLEAKEFLGSYYIVDVDSLDRAIELAAKLPAAGLNGVRVWPLMDDSGSEM
jgi:hypothetical protein